MDEAKLKKIVDKIYYVSLEEQVQKLDRDAQIRRYIELYEKFKGEC